MSEEDVAPRWTSRAIGAENQRVVSRNDGRFIRNDTGLRVKLPGVCVACNTGWMSRLEKRVAPWLRPALLGEQIALAMPQQATVAFWAAKTAMLYELASRKVRPPLALPESNLRWLYDHREDRQPPPGTQVWLARVDPMTATDPERFTISGAISASLRSDSPNIDPDGSAIHYINTFRFACFVAQVFGQDFASATHAPDGRLLSLLLPPSVVESFQVRIWPDSDQVVVWPPVNTLQNADIPEFSAWVRGLTSYVVGIGPSTRRVFADSDNRARFGKL